MGNYDRKTIEAGIGGAMTDTFGVRVAARYDETGGHLIDVITEQKYPARKDYGGRATFVWEPNEVFSASLKAEYMVRRSEGDPDAICVTGQEDFFEGRDQKIEAATLVEGEVPAWDAIFEHKYTLPNCADKFGRFGVEDGAPTAFHPILGIRGDNNRSGLVDLIDLSTEQALSSGILDPNCPLCAVDDMDAANFRLGLTYEFANGISIESITGTVDYERIMAEDPQPSAFVVEVDYRTEEFGMWSQEFRVRSPAGGQFEWETGVYYQVEQLDLDPAHNIRANIRRPLKEIKGWGDNRWMSAFATVTYNFLDDKASIDVGARYTDVHKESWMQGLASTLIFDIDPDPDGDLEVLDTPGTGSMDMGDDIIDCATGHRQCGSFGAGFWTHKWRVNFVPAQWDTQEPVAFGPALDRILRNIVDEPAGILEGVHDDDSFDPQIVLRYRPTDNISTYAKWAKAFKAGGFDTGHKSPPRPDAFEFPAETAENFEVGAKGSILGGRAQVNATLFWMTINNLQGETSGVFVDPNTGELISEGSDAAIAGKARNRGVEFSLLWAATDRLRVGLSGALNDAEYVSFPGAGCNDAELTTPETNDCFSVDESIALIGTDDLAGTIDRSGQQLPRTPEYKIMMNLDYDYPLFDNYKATFNTRLALSDGYIVNVTDYEELVKFGSHENLDISVGFGDINDAWNVSVWGRNLTKTQIEYFPEFAGDPRAREVMQMPQSYYTTYGLQLTYNWR
jgi:outer membrane receptor protein involved in Fe transport